MSQLIHRFIMPMIAVVLAAAPLSGQTTEIRSSQTIKICAIEFTDSGRAAAFRFVYTFTLTTRENGSVDSIKRIHENEYPKFIREEKLPDCMKEWTLEPNKKYFIYISVGTTSGPNSITVSDMTDKKTLRLEMPF